MPPSKWKMQIMRDIIFEDFDLFYILKFHPQAFSKVDIKMSEKRELLINCWWGCTFSSATMANSVEVPQKLKIELSCDPLTPVSGIYPQRVKASLLKGTCHIHVYNCTAGNSKPGFLPRWTLLEWMNIKCGLIHNGLSQPQRRTQWYHF